MQYISNDVLERAAGKYSEYYTKYGENFLNQFYSDTHEDINFGKQIDLIMDSIHYAKVNRDQCAMVGAILMYFLMEAQLEKTPTVLCTQN